MKKSREIAFLGIISALSVVFLLLGAIVEVLDITSAILASLLLLIANEELKGKAIMVYFATTIISALFFMFSPLPALEYAIFALYPLIKPLFEKTPRVIAYILKGVYIIFASLGSTVLIYFLVPASVEKPYMLAVYVAMFSAVIILFDLLIVRFKRYYQFKLRSMLRIDRFFK